MLQPSQLNSRSKGWFPLPVLTLGIATPQWGDFSLEATRWLGRALEQKT